MTALWAYVILAVGALLVGSVLNVIIYRLPIMIQAEWVSHCQQIFKQDLKQPITTMNLFTPRSFCIHCKNTIPIWHNIPLLSYLILKGRCRQCHQAISIQYPLIEACALGLALLAAWHFGFNNQLIAALGFIGLVITLTTIDIQHQLLPDGLTLGLLWLGLMVNTQSLFTSLTEAVLSAAGGYLALWLIIKLYYLITGKIGMGHGDFKLFAALGAWFGWTHLPFLLLVASITGAVGGMIYLKTTHQSHNTPIPFGPFLCFAGLIMLFIHPYNLSHLLQ